MAFKTIGVDVPEDSLSSAALGLGLDMTMTTRTAVVRAALALARGVSRQEAKEIARPKPANPSNLGSSGQDRVTARLPEDEVITMPGEKLAYTVRYGLAIAAGVSAKQAENFARMGVRPVGRPRKDEG